MVTSPIVDLGFGHSSVKTSLDDCYVACIIAAFWFSISNATSGDSIDTDYDIRVQYLGLLLCSASELELLGGTYSVQRLHRIGYVEVAREALILANLRTNCRNGTLWELECSNSQIDVGTCHDSSLALIQLVTQLQQFFAPDLEESLVHLWRNHLKAEARTSVGDLAPSTPQVHSSSANVKSRALVIGLMDEIREDAFLSDGSRTCQYDSESNEESFLGEKLSGSVPLLGLESSQATFIRKGYFPEFIEGYFICRLCIALLPLRLYLRQRQLESLISFFGNEDPSQDWSSGVQNNLVGSELLPQNAHSGSMQNAIDDEALLPYFQKFDIKPFSVRVDYTPQPVELAALGGGKYVELVNLVPRKGYIWQQVLTIPCCKSCKYSTFSVASAM
ncbi:hypothetical protein NL676_014689 [Syzygium grande]|nr:hypothetical protein NL676_014689 [Syzygium grande]